MAPNIRPPGNLMRNIIRAARLETAMRIASSASEDSTTPRVDSTGSTVRPNSASPAGKPSTISSTRITCTIAMPRRTSHYHDMSRRVGVPPDEPVDETPNDEAAAEDSAAA